MARNTSKIRSIYYELYYCVKIDHPEKADPSYGCASAKPGKVLTCRVQKHRLGEAKRVLKTLMECYADDPACFVRTYAITRHDVRQPHQSPRYAVARRDRVRGGEWYKDAA